MALGKKGTRKIIVGGVSYRWMIKRKYKHANDLIEVFVEKIMDGNTVLCVQTGYMRPDSAFSNMGEINQGIVTPAKVESYIQEALNHGWQPE